MQQYFKKVLAKQIDEYVLRLDTGEQEIPEIIDYLLDITNKITAESLVVNYSYVTDEKMKMNRVKYVTRATFKRFNTLCRDLLYNFRNSVVWGWTKAEQALLNEETTEHIKLCPVCEKNNINSTIHWKKLEKITNHKFKQHEQTTGNSRKKLYYTYSRTEEGVDADNKESSTKASTNSSRAASFMERLRTNGKAYRS